MNEKLAIDKNLIELAKIFEPFTKLYIVGGFVRDSLINRACEDIDLTSNMKIEKLKTILEGTKFKIFNKNENIGAVTIVDGKKNYDYTTFRQEEYDKGKHFPKKVKFVEKIEDDVKRRDFTVNALYFDINSNNVVDLVDGASDLKKKLLKAVQKDTLKFDGERILRLVKYSCLLHFGIEKETFLMAKENCKNIYDLSDNMINSYRCFFKTLSFFKRQRAKNIFKKLGIKKFF